VSPDCSRHHHGAHPTFGMPEMAADENAPLPARVFLAMRRVMVAHKQLLMRRLAEKNAHLGQAFTLAVLARHEAVNPSELAGILGVRRPTVTIMLKKMERAGLVERRADEQDQRYMRVYLTQSGRELHQELEAVLTEISELTVGDMPDSDQLELERLLYSVESNLTEALVEERDPSESERP